MTQVPIPQQLRVNIDNAGLLGNNNDTIRGAGIQVETEASNNSANASGELYDTLINSVFASSTQPECQQANTYNNICSQKELPCIFEFLGTCSPRREDDVVYGNSCLKHNNDASRTFTPMASQTTVDMQPISLKIAACEKNMFLWSFVTNLSYAKAKELISFMDIGTVESSNLAKFLMVVSEPMGQRVNSEEYQRLYQYLSVYCQHAIKCIESIPDRDKILIPIVMGEKFLMENKRNRLVSDIYNKAINQKLYSYQTIGNTNNVYQIFVPLKALNILDQINLLSYRIYCGVGRTALSPNVSVTNDRIIIGSGLSIRNALTSVDISKLRSMYPENIYRIIRNVHGDNVHNNYDVLVLLAVPNNVNFSISPQIFIAKRSYITSTFDIDKLDVFSFC